MTTTERVAHGVRRLCETLAEPFSAPDSRTFLPALLVFALVALAVHAYRTRTFRPAVALGLHAWRTPSSRLDAQLLLVRQLLRWLGVLRVGSGLALAGALVRALDATLGQPSPPPLPDGVVVAVYSLTFFVVADLSRFLVHRAMHRVPALWELHKVHHSAEALTPLTFHRVHPVETALLELRGLLVTAGLGGLAFWIWRGQAAILTVLGVEAIGLVLNTALGNLRHSHVWLPLPAVVERWLLSPAQHQLHHGAAPSQHFRNLGTWLAVWDRIDGTFASSGTEPPAAFGLARPNHAQDLGSALVDPLRAAWARLRRGRGVAAPSSAVAAALALLAPASAHAEDAPEDEPAPEEIVVSATGARPTVAGAAHEVSEETLSRYEHDDIQRVLARVPGVYVRGEDGFGLRPNIGMRGASSDRSAKITLLEDGVPLSPAPYAAPAAYYFPITTRLVGVEVFKGPSAIAYGPQTIGGAVNVLTRGIPDGGAGQVDMAYGTWGSAKAHAWGGASGRVGGFVLEGATVSSDGFQHLDGGGPTGFERQDLTGRARLHLPGAERNDLELKVGYGHERSDQSYLGLSLADFEADPYRRYAASALDEMRWERSAGSLSWDLRTADNLSVRTTLYRHDLHRVWRKLNGFDGGPDLHDLLLAPEAGQAAAYMAVLRGEEDGATSEQRLLIGTNDRRYANTGLQSVARWWIGGAGTSGRVSNLVEAGVRLHADDVARVHTEDAYDMRAGVPVDAGDPTETTMDSATRARALAVHARDTLTVGRFTAVPGLRVEHVVTAAGTTDSGPVDPQARTIALPGLALSADVGPWASVFGGVHRGFSPVAPGAAEGTLPETAWNAEAGARLSPGVSYVEVVGFGSSYDNLQGQCSLSSGCIDDLDAQYNGGGVLVAGAEAVASHEVGLPYGLTLTTNGSFTYTWSAFQGDFTSDFPVWGAVRAGDRLPYVPETQGSAELVLASARGSLGITSTYRGDMRDVAGQGAIPDAERIPAALVLDVAADVRVDERLTAYVTVRNATDAVTMESLRPFGARPGAPRTVLVGLKMDGGAR